MSPTTAQPCQQSSLFRPRSAFSMLAPKFRSDTVLRVPPPTPRTSGSDEEIAPSAPVSRGSGSEFILGTSDVQPDGLPSYVHALSQSKPTSYRFVQDSAFSMSVVKQDEPSSVAYNISVGANVWMPSEHITLVRRHANLDGPVLARLE